MDYIIVTVRFPNSAEWELKIPSYVSSDELINMLHQSFILKKEKVLRLHSDPPGRILDNRETLEEAGVWNGAIMTLILM